MATKKKPGSKKTSTSAIKKRSAKTVPKKKIVLKKKSAFKKKTSSIKSQLSNLDKKIITVKKRRWFTFFRTAAMIMILIVGAVIVSLDSSLFKKFKATILDEPVSEIVSIAEAKGLLLAYDSNGVNEQKLVDIFQSVFPETGIKVVNYDSTEGQQLVSRLNVTEVPNIYFEKTAFESEKLSEVVKDLFQLQGNYYGLNVPLVNPSEQVWIKGGLNSEGAIWIGEETAPIVAYIYSDLKCQHCRANEKNNSSKWKALADEGIVRLAYMDLPQDTESTTQSIALSCFYDQTKDGQKYFDLRADLFSRINLTVAYTTRELERLGVDFQNDCDAAAYRTLFRNRLKTSDSEGITGVPAMYIGKTGASNFIRLTGEKDFSEYQKILDKLLGQATP